MSKGRKSEKFFHKNGRFCGQSFSRHKMWGNVAAFRWGKRKIRLTEVQLFSYNTICAFIWRQKSEPRPGLCPRRCGRRGLPANQEQEVQEHAENEGYDLQPQEASASEGPRLPQAYGHRQRPQDPLQPAPRWARPPELLRWSGESNRDFFGGGGVFLPPYLCRARFFLPRKVYVHGAKTGRSIARS